MKKESCLCCLQQVTIRGCGPGIFLIDCGLQEVKLGDRCVNTYGG